MLSHIIKKETMNTGGGCIVDLLYLEDGRVIGISSDIIVLYPSIKAFNENSGDVDYPFIELY